MRAEAYLVFVQREMHHTAPELKEFFTPIAVTPVLLDGIFDRLLGKAVFSSNVAMGRPLMKIARSRESCVSLRL